MRTFKFINSMVMALIMCLIVTGCSNDEDPSKTEEVEFITVPLSFSYDIDIEDLPLSKAENDIPYYAFNVLEYNENTSGYERYAEGIFDNINGLTIELKKNHKYEINTILLYNYLENYQFSHPVTNKFNYKDPRPTLEVEGVYLEPFTLKGQRYSKRCALVNAYFGKVTEWIPSDFCQIEMKRITTGIKFQITGVTEGKIVVDYPLEVELPVSNNMEFIFTDSELTRGNKVHDEFEFPLSFKYIDRNGKETPIYNQNTIFKRGFKKSILLNINETTQELNSNLSFNLEQLEMQDEPQQKIEVQL